MAGNCMTCLLHMSHSDSCSYLDILMLRIHHQSNHHRRGMFHYSGTYHDWSSCWCRQPACGHKIPSNKKLEMSSTQNNKWTSKHCFKQINLLQRCAVNNMSVCARRLLSTLLCRRGRTENFPNQHKSLTQLRPLCDCLMRFSELQKSFI